MLDRFLNILVRNTGVDFYQYKPTTLQRRIVRRMHLLNMASEDEYLAYLTTNGQEQHLLYKEMLIHVSSFFRDESSFDYLCAEVISAILKDKNADEVVRVWVCGCATGEEAYSIAICFHEHLKKNGDLARIKIFASDLSENIIAKARRAVYPAASVSRLSENRQQEYFLPHRDGYQVAPFIRDMCVFAVHNVLSHPPFPNIDLLSCRNVLIYMKPVLQKKVLATFSYALRENGYLFLGKSETSGLAGKFDPVNKNANVFINRERNTKLFVAGNKLHTSIAEMNTSDRSNTLEKRDFQRATDDLLLAKYVPAGVVVNDAFDIVDFRGSTGFYIEPSPGIASLSVLKMVRKGLYYDLHEALGIAKSERIAVRKDGIALEHDGILLRINLEIQPLSGTRERFYLILFKEVPQPAGSSPLSDDGINNTRDLRIHQLEQELMQSREQLRALSEEQEATSEEFQSANEELRTLNEELQTSQEELISTNDELTLRNRELNQVNKDLARARALSDSVNDTVKDSLLVLDRTLRIRSANASFYKTFSTTPGDTEEQLIYELGTRQWAIPELRRQLERVLHDKTELTDYVVNEVFPDIGHRVMKVSARSISLPDNSDPLMLMAISDITEAFNLEQQTNEANARLKFAFDAGRIGSWEISLPDEQLNTSDQFRLNIGCSASDACTYSAFQSMMAPEDAEAFREGIAAAIHTRDTYRQDMRVTWPDGSAHWLAISGMVKYQANGLPSGFIGISVDITDRKIAELRLRHSEQHFKTLAESAPVMISMTDGDGQFNFYNKRWLSYTGRDEADHSGNWQADIHPDDKEAYADLFEQSISKHTNFGVEFRLRHKGRYRWISCEAMPRFTIKGGFDGYTIACTDIHDQKMSAEALERQVRERTEALHDMNDELMGKNRELEQFAYVTSHDLQEPLRKIRMFTSVLQRNEDESSERSDYLTKIEFSASRMIHLIQDLLNYSSLKEKSRDFVPTDLSRIVQHVLQDFDLLIQEKGAILTISSLPSIDAVPLQMTQLFYNLISNALKFSRPGETPAISITAGNLSPDEVHRLKLPATASYTRILVRDNGIGFNKDYSERIFEIFQRLHTQDHYQGNGIGLALCRKVVINHNGLIIPHSEEGKGTTFEITLPLKQQAGSH